jgi:hypothetical protein
VFQNLQLDCSYQWQRSKLRQKRLRGSWSSQRNNRKRRRPNQLLMTESRALEPSRRQCCVGKAIEVSQQLEFGRWRKESEQWTQRSHRASPSHRLCAQTHLVESLRARPRTISLEATSRAAWRVSSGAPGLATVLLAVVPAPWV